MLQMQVGCLTSTGIAIVLFVCPPPISQSTTSQPSSELTAEEILRRTREVYSKCKTYRDTGYLEGNSRESPLRLERTREFTTAFVRPGQFRYQEWDKKRANEVRQIIWRNGQQVKTWWGGNKGRKIIDRASLDKAIDPPISVGGEHTVVMLLMPGEVHGPGISGLRNLMRLEDKTVDGHNCYVVAGRGKSTSATIWVDSRQFLVRRVEDVNSYITHERRGRRTFNPVIDEPIPESSLAFRPPENDTK